MACEGAKDTARGHPFLSELGINKTLTLTMDSEAAFYLAQTNVYMRHTRHIDY